MSHSVVTLTWCCPFIYAACTRLELRLLQVSPGYQRALLLTEEWWLHTSCRISLVNNCTKVANSFNFVSRWKAIIILMPPTTQWNMLLKLNAYQALCAGTCESGNLRSRLWKRYTQTGCTVAVLLTQSFSSRSLLSLVILVSPAAASPLSCGPHLNAGLRWEQLT